MLNAIRNCRIRGKGFVIEWKIRLNAIRNCRISGKSLVIKWKIRSNAIINVKKKGNLKKKEKGIIILAFNNIRITFKFLKIARTINLRLWRRVIKLKINYCRISWSLILFLFLKKN